MKYLVMIAIYIGVIVLVWVAGKLFADSVSDREVFSPVNGVQCVSVNRMFNTSVDCWKE